MYKFREAVRPILLWSVLITVLSGCGGGGDAGTASGSSSDGAPPPSSSPPSGSSSLSVTWDAPTTDADGTCSADLSGYIIHYGVRSRIYPLNDMVPVNAVSCVDSGTEPVAGCGNSMVCTYTINNLGAANWYVAVQAYDNVGNRSIYSNEIVRTVQ
jgi:hypothetical protein